MCNMHHSLSGNGRPWLYWGQFNMFPVGLSHAYFFVLGGHKACSETGERGHGWICSWIRHCLFPLSIKTMCLLLLVVLCALSELLSFIPVWREEMVQFLILH